MKLQRTPIILLLLAVLLGGVVYLNEQTAPQEDAQKKTLQIFSFQESDVQSVTLNTAQQTLSFTRTPAAPLPQTAQNTAAPTASVASVWQMTTPQKVAANDAYVAFLLNVLTTAKPETTLTIPAAKQAEFGFDRPLARIEVALKNRQTHRLIVGKPNFNRSGLYAQIDPPTTPSTDLALALVPVEFENAVNRSVSEWKKVEPNVNQTPVKKSAQHDTSH